MNNFVCIGRLARDFKYSDNGKTATGSIAVSRPFPFHKDKDGNEVTDFFTLKFLGDKNVETCRKYLTKGSKICVRGIVCRDSWKDGDSWKEFNYIIVQEWEFCQSKAESEIDQHGQAANSSQGRTQQKPESSGDFMKIPDGIDETLPFA